MARIGDTIKEIKEGGHCLKHNPSLWQLLEMIHCPGLERRHYGIGNTKYIHHYASLTVSVFFSFCKVRDDMQYLEKACDSLDIQWNTFVLFFDVLLQQQKSTIVGKLMEQVYLDFWQSTRAHAPRIKRLVLINYFSKCSQELTLAMVTSSLHGLVVDDQIQHNQSFAVKDENRL
jgi:hypothetical protein